MVLLFILKYTRTDWVKVCFWGLCWLPGSVCAHGFAQRYDLPVPLSLYLAGAAMTVVVSFVVITLFVRRGVVLDYYPRMRLPDFFTVSVAQNKYWLFLWQSLSILLLILIVVAGWWGVQSPFKNIVPTLVWVIWWVGLAYCSGLLGDLWSLLNPWKNSFLLFEWSSKRYLGIDSISFNVALPWWVGVWPALVFFVIFSWIELIWRHSDVPSAMASLVLVYTLLTWLGMVVFGRVQWLQSGEAFTRVFELLSRFSMTEKNQENHQWYLRPYGLGLLVESPVSISLVVFVVFMLSTVTFDGFMATPLWTELVEWAIYSERLRPILVMLQPVFGDAIAVISTLGLLAFPLLFSGIFLLCCALMRLLAGPINSPDMSDMAGYFVMTLIPIALAYHLAHYLSFLLIVGQYMIPLVSDPFGYGWDLFGTKHYFVDIGIVNARFIWVTSVIVIVVGHIIAVFLSHVMAQRLFENQRQVVMSQIPMMVLMVGYTMVSLWILAQPIVE
jgi:hypothetical protein